MTNEELVEKAVEKNGALQLLKTAEECAELNQAILKYVFRPTVENEERIIEEAGDVLVTIQYVILIMGELNVKRAEKKSYDNLKDYLKEEVFYE